MALAMTGEYIPAKQDILTDLAAGATVYVAHALLLVACELHVHDSVVLLSTFMHKQQYKVSIVE